MPTPAYAMERFPPPSQLNLLLPTHTKPIGKTPVPGPPLASGRNDCQLPSQDFLRGILRHRGKLR